MYLSASQYFHFEDDSRYPGERKVRTDGYAYRIRSSEDRRGEMFQWHWHPEVPGREHCHLHVGAVHEDRDLHKLHLPTGRVAFEEVLSLLLDEFEVHPARDDFLDVLAGTRLRFETFRTWPGAAPPPPRPDV